MSQGIFHPGRYLEIGCAGDDSIGFHRAEAVSQDFLADALQISAEFVETPGAHKQVAQDQEFPLASDQLHSRSHRTCGKFVFCQYFYHLTVFRYLFCAMDRLFCI